MNFHSSNNAHILMQNKTTTPDSMASLPHLHPLHNEIQLAKSASPK
jgi:hypothetical protein